MSDQFVLTRQRLSEPDHVKAGADLRSEQGGQLEWFWGLPGVFRALASPFSGQLVPAAPEPRDPHAQSLGYWAALHYVLLHRLGWAHPGQGLRWWYDKGKPVDDPTLALVAEMWDRDGNLDAYLGWLLQGRPGFLDPACTSWARWPREIEPLSPQWRDWAARPLSAAARVSAHYFQGGWDALHLTGHSGEGGVPDPASAIAVISRNDRRAVFLTNTMDAWYFDLSEKAKGLPNIGSQVWRVDVFVRPVGFLGTYRQSSETGRWFTGRHRYHVRGN